MSRIDQRILDEFIKEGYFERYLNKMRKVYRDKHDLLLKSLEVFEGKFEISGENAGLHILMTSKCGEREDVLIGKAAEQAVKVYGLSESCIGTEKDSSTVILGYGGLTETEITDGVKKLAKAWLDK